MEIYVFDDKAEQVEIANAAIAAAGPTPMADRKALSTLAMRMVLRSAENIAADGDEGSGDDLFREITRAVERMKRQGGGIITDLMFHNTHRLDHRMPPAGLLVVIQAIAAGVPVVICTNAAEEGGHHSEAISWIFDGYVSKFQGWHSSETQCPFGWVEDKDWGKAVAMLADMRAKMDASRSA